MWCVICLHPHSQPSGCKHKALPGFLCRFWGSEASLPLSHVPPNSGVLFLYLSQGSTQSRLALDVLCHCWGRPWTPDHSTSHSLWWWVCGTLSGWFLLLVFLMPYSTSLIQHHKDYSCFVLRVLWCMNHDPLGCIYHEMVQTHHSGSYNLLDPAPFIC